MTSIACWFDQSNGQCIPWAAADSRISAKTREVPLFDSGSKLFSFPLIVRKQWVYGEQIHSSRIGLGFSGNTILGQNTALAAATIVSNLVIADESKLLALSDIADCIGRILNAFSAKKALEVGSAELLLTGFCPALDRWRIFHVAADAPCVREFLSEPRDAVLLLGSHQSEIRNLIAEKRSAMPIDSLTWLRAPKDVLAGVIREGCFESIGGNLQLGIGTTATRGFDLFAEIQPSQGKSADAIYLGLDIARDIGSIGPCFVGMPGMP